MSSARVAPKDKSNLLSRRRAASDVTREEECSAPLPPPGDRSVRARPDIQAYTLPRCDFLQAAGSVPRSRYAHGIQVRGRITRRHDEGHGGDPRQSLPKPHRLPSSTCRGVGVRTSCILRAGEGSGQVAQGSGTSPGMRVWEARSASWGRPLPAVRSALAWRSEEPRGRNFRRTGSRGMRTAPSRGRPTSRLQPSEGGSRGVVPCLSPRSQPMTA